MRLRRVGTGILGAVREINFLAVFWGFWLLGCTAFQFYPRTAAGVHCPTAVVQSVTVAVRDCCGHQVGQVTRAPKPGEKGFVQCQCADKKNAQHEQSLPPKLEPFPSENFQLEVATVLPEPLAIHHYFEQFRTLSVPPLVRPPDLA